MVDNSLARQDAEQQQPSTATVVSPRTSEVLPDLYAEESAPQPILQEDTPEQVSSSHVVVDEVTDHSLDQAVDQVADHIAIDAMGQRTTHDQHHLHELREQVQALKEACDAAEEGKRDLAQQVDQLHAERTELQLRLAQAEAAAAAAAAEQQTSVTALRSECEQLRQQLEAASSVHDQSAEELAEWKQLVADLKFQLAERSHELEAVRAAASEAAARAAALEGEVAQAQQVAQQAQEAAHTAQESSAQLEQRCKDAEKKAADMRGKLEKGKSGFDKLKIQVAELKKVVEVKEAQVWGMCDDRGRKYGCAARPIHACTKMDLFVCMCVPCPARHPCQGFCLCQDVFGVYAAWAQIAQLKESMQAAGTDTAALSAAEERAAQAQVEASVAREQLAEAQAQLRQLSQQAQQVVHELEVSQQTAAEATEAASRTAQDLETLRQQLQQAQADASASTQQEVDALRQQLGTLNHQLGALQAESEAHSQAAQAAQAAAVAAGEAVDAARSEAEELRVQRDQLQDELKSAQERQLQASVEVSQVGFWGVGSKGKMGIPMGSSITAHVLPCQAWDFDGSCDCAAFNVWGKNNSGGGGSAWCGDLWGLAILISSIQSDLFQSHTQLRLEVEGAQSERARLEVELGQLKLDSARQVCCQHGTPWQVVQQACTPPCAQHILPQTVISCAAGAPVSIVPGTACAWPGTLLPCWLRGSDTWITSMSAMLVPSVSCSRWGMLRRPWLQRRLKLRHASMQLTLLRLNWSLCAQSWRPLSSEWVLLA